MSHLAGFMLCTGVQFKIFARRNEMLVSRPKSIQPAPRIIPTQANVLPLSLLFFFFISLSPKIPVINAVSAQRLRKETDKSMIVMITRFAGSGEDGNASENKTQYRPRLSSAKSPLTKLIIERRLVLIELFIDCSLGSNFFVAN